RQARLAFISAALQPNRSRSISSCYFNQLSACAGFCRVARSKEDVGARRRGARRSIDGLTHGRSPAAAAIRSRAHRCADESWPSGMDEASDEDLMGRIAKGDEPAFRLLARRYAARGLARARRITGNDADAEELVQEALLRVGITAPRGRPLAAFRTWFYRVVLTLSLSRHRRGPFLPLDAAGDLADPAPDASVALERREADRRLATAIAELPDRQHAALALTYQEGLSNSEVAARPEPRVARAE